MTDLALIQVDAFADRPFTGNPAAVVVTDAALPVPLMQRIAAEQNLSETAFVVPSGDGWHIRWFTPTVEAAFCGHATLAAVHVLMVRHGVRGPVRLTTEEVGPLVVTQVAEARYRLDLPRFDPAEAPEAAQAAVRALFPEARAVFANFENLFAVLPDAAAVRAAAPDLSAVALLPAGGLVLTAPGGEDGNGAPVDFTSRYFAPQAGIPEDPATGSIHATLAPYWAAELGRTVLAGFQASARGARLDCEVGPGRVGVTGGAVTMLSGTLHLPAT